MNKVLVFFDGNCNLCLKEINFYKLKDLEKTIDWIDVNKSKSLLSKYKITFNDSLLFLHVINKKGEIKKGVDGFIIIWKELKIFSALTFFLSFGVVKKIMNKLYVSWAKKRFRGLNYKCNNS